MKQCSIDAEYHGEERYSKLALAYKDESEREQIEGALSDAQSLSSLTPNIYTTNISGGRSVLVIEYHDDYDREAGKVFDKILGTLGIEVCE